MFSLDSCTRSIMLSTALHICDMHRLHWLAVTLCNLPLDSAEVTRRYTGCPGEIEKPKVTWFWTGVFGLDHRHAARGVCAWVCQQAPGDIEVRAVRPLVAEEEGRVIPQGQTKCCAARGHKSRAGVVTLLRCCAASRVQATNWVDFGETCVPLAFEGLRGT
jgi:hypothetical protein